jgi:hypothetical protein
VHPWRPQPRRRKQQVIDNAREMTEIWLQRARADCQDISQAELAVTVTHGRCSASAAERQNRKPAKPSRPARDTPDDATWVGWATRGSKLMGASLGCGHHMAVYRLASGSANVSALWQSMAVREPT